MCDLDLTDDLDPQELESERTKLIEDVTANKKKMQELEDNLLYRLTSVQGSLVDDEDIIQVRMTPILMALAVFKESFMTTTLF